MMALENDIKEATVQNKIGQGCWGKFVFFVCLALSIFDVGSDVYSVVIYWRHKDDSHNGLETAIIATIFLAIGAVIFTVQTSCIVCTMIKECKHGIGECIKQSKKALNICKVSEAMLESLPQLCISLYTLSVSNHQPTNERVILYVSALISFISVSYSVVTSSEFMKKHGPTAKLLYPGDNDTESESDADRSNNNVRAKIVRTDAAHSDSNDKPGEVDTYSKCARYILYFSNTVVVASRILILVYMSVQIGWWTALFVGVHSILVLTFLTWIFYDDFLLKAIAIAALYSAISILCWITRDSMKAKFGTLTVLIIENVVGLGVSYNREPFHLHGHVIVTHILLIVLALATTIIYAFTVLRLRFAKQKSIMKNQNDRDSPQSKTSHALPQGVRTFRWYFR